MLIHAMRSYRLKRPKDRTRKGQKGLPTGYRYHYNGHVIELPWGTVVEARESCEYPFEFNEDEQKWLAHVDFLEPRNHMFEQV